MNLNRTLERQERTIVRLRRSNDKLIEENRALHLENERLSYKNALYLEAIGDIEKIKEEYQSYISEAKGYRDKYKEALFSIKNIHKDAEKKVEKFNKQFNKAITKGR